jgi:hypothetical protein
MKHTSAFSCDVCGRAKGAVNHWWMITPARAAMPGIGAMGLSAGPQLPVEQLVISAWNDELASDPAVRHSCGNGCTQKMLERWLATGIVETPRTAAGNPEPKANSQEPGADL